MTEPKLTACIITGSTITAVIGGKPYSIDRSNPNAKPIFEAIRTGVNPGIIAEMYDLAAGIRRYLKDEVEVRDGVVMFNGEVIHNTVSDRILSFMSDGLDAEPLIKFLKNLMANPSRTSITQLYSFLEKEGLPITKDGNFLALIFSASCR